MSGRKPKHGARVQRGLEVIIEVVEDELAGQLLIANALDKGAPADISAALDYLRRLVEWKRTRYAAAKDRDPETQEPRHGT